MIVFCAAVGFDDTEHLYRFALPTGYYSPHELATYEDLRPDVALRELGLRNGDPIHLHYDMGDSWQFLARVQTILLAVTPALWAHARASDTPALQYAQTGRAPRQYPHYRADW